ncbi:MAG: hypothetical protein IKI90_05315 [Treponema sp.]|nr:hypothetical protein [Treponema sp.]MBR4005248.1 hypothetical protein [Treponema sp.]
MKKILSLCACALLAVSLATAQSTPTSVEEDKNPKVDISTQVRQIEDKYAEFHPTASIVTLELEYTPLTGEVIVNYTCLAASYDQGEAMNTIDAILEEFAQENQFLKKPVYVRKDRQRYFKDARNIRMASCRRWVRFDNR